MKLFGKRKKTSSSAGIESSSSPHQALVKSDANDDVKVTSYFSSNFKPASACVSDTKEDNNKDAGHDIDALLAMEPTSLNAKQRRVLRRHQKRSGQPNESVAVGNKTSNDQQLDENPVKEENDTDLNDSEVPVANEQHDDAREKEKVNKKRKIVDDNASTPTTPELNLSVAPESTPPIQSGEEIVQQLQSAENIAQQLKGLNSKERRKMLRKLCTDNQDDPNFKEILEHATELSKKIAQENVEEDMANSKSAKKDEIHAQMLMNLPPPPPPPYPKISNSSTQENPPRKKKKLKDFSHLPSEERMRREKQRQMQQEAIARREAGDIPTRHPLNSERRRANRRKPGKAGKIALMKKERRENQQTLRMFNESGYQMRHIKKNENGSGNSGGFGKKINHN